MDRDTATRLLFTLDGRVKHGAAAQLSAREEAALVLKAAGWTDFMIAGLLRMRRADVPALLDGAAARLAEWHHRQACDTIAVCENRPVRERASYPDPVTGEPVELQQSGSAEDEGARQHPDLKPSPDTLMAPLYAALSAICR